MQLIQLLLVGLAGSASAVDVFFSCSGSTQGCRNLNPNQCCDGARLDFTPHIGFYGIPTNWNLNCRGHNGGNCNQFKSSTNSNGANFVCLNAGYYSGAGYSFANKKRDVVYEAGASDEECVKPNTIRFEDGVQFDITKLEDAAVDQIMEVVNSGGNSTMVPAEFHSLKL